MLPSCPPTAGRKVRRTEHRTFALVASRSDSFRLLGVTAVGGRPFAFGLLVLAILLRLGLLPFGLGLDIDLLGVVKKAARRP